MAHQAKCDFKDFKKLLKENDADSADSFVAFLLRLTQHMIPEEKRNMKRKSLKAFEDYKNVSGMKKALFVTKNDSSVHRLLKQENE